MKWLNQISFSTKLYIGFGVLLFFSLLVASVSLLQLRELQKINQGLSAKWLPSIGTLRNVTDAFDRYLIREQDYLNAKDELSRKKFKRTLDSLHKIIDNSILSYDSLSSETEKKGAFTDFRNKMEEFYANSKLLLDLADINKSDSAFQLRRTKTRIQLLEDVRKNITILTRNNIRGGIQAADRGDEIFTSTFLTLGLVLGISILLGSTIAFFTARSIIKQVGGEPRKIAAMAQQVSMGDLDIPLEDTKLKDYSIYASVKRIVITLKEIVNITTIISKGNTSEKLSVKSEKDILGSSINNMIDSFKEQNHIKDGLNDLSERITGNIALIEISQRALNFISRFTEAAQGVLYLPDKQKEDSFKLFASFAYSERNALSNEYRLGEGLIGQVALEKKEIILKNITRKDALITTGLVQEVPQMLIAMPLLYENQHIKAIIELSFTTPITENQMVFLKEAMRIVANYIHSAEQNDEVKRLLNVSEEATREAQAKAEEIAEANAQLAQQQEELRAQAEELNERNETLEQTQEDLQRRSEELEKANTAMEEVNENLEKLVQERTFEITQQKEEIEAQRDSLEQAIEDLEHEKQKSESLLLNILPAQVAEELKKNGKTRPQEYKLTTVLFTDFQGFTQKASQMDGDTLVTELNEVFEEFDRIIERYNLEKIKTIGDAYMCVGGLPLPNKTNPIDAVLAGLDIQRFMQRKWEDYQAIGKDYWRLRLGINSGQVIAGVIGKKKFAYDIWGDAVNLASRMESSGEVGKVNISANTYEFAQHFFDCESRGMIEVKGKGQTEMFFVKSIKSDLATDNTCIVPNEKFWKLVEKLNHTKI
ncbi:MAG: hypothetical protein EAZ55_05115 [Cytophagales bacterium]|nr:MAG: hypothetical protein EAZ55_05115 [Cytophagales bacterium]